MAYGEPTIRGLSSRQRVLEAIAEYNQLGGAEFLARYGYDRSRRYRLRYEGMLYESKVIAGVSSS